MILSPPCSTLFPYTTLFRSFFFAKVNPALNTANSLQYSTYIGGSTPANGVVVGGAVAVDASFNVYLAGGTNLDRKSTRLNSSHVSISYAVFCLKKKIQK